MSRRNVNRASAAIHGDELGGQDHGCALKKGVLRADAFESVAGKRFHRFAGRLEAGSGTKLWDQFVRENESFCFCSRGRRARVRAGWAFGRTPAAVSDRGYRPGEFLDNINFFWVHGNEQIRWKGPRCRGPDRNAGLIFEPPGNDRELYEDGSVVAFLIFYFRFREGSLCARAPENRFF